MNITVNVATHINGLIKLTNDKDEPVEADVSTETKGFDPVDSVNLKIQPKVNEPFTCHILFPEISFDSLPASVTLGIKINSSDTNVVFDGADKSGPCVALPLYRNGAWVQGGNTLDLGRSYMVWKEKRERRLEPPFRIKYLLIMSNNGGPIDVDIQGINIAY